MPNDHGIVTWRFCQWIVGWGFIWFSSRHWLWLHFSQGTLGSEKFCMRVGWLTIPLSTQDTVESTFLPGVQDAKRVFTSPWACKISLHCILIPGDQAQKSERMYVRQNGGNCEVNIYLGCLSPSVIYIFMMEKHFMNHNNCDNFVWQCTWMYWHC